MPDVGLFTAGEPVAPETKIVIKYAVEVGGLPVYQESYDVDKLCSELEEDGAKALRLWQRRLLAPVECRKMPKFSANLTSVLACGKAPYNSSEPEDDS